MHLEALRNIHRLVGRLKREPVVAALVPTFNAASDSEYRRNG